MHDSTTWLNEQEKLSCLNACSEMIDTQAHNSDVLLVGGEAYCDHGEKVNAAMAQLYAQIAHKIREGEVRFLYANTNLTYANKTNLLNLFAAFDGIEDSLKFTTSYDLNGRFNSEKKQLFLQNLRFINDEYPKINTVVNTIVTRAVADAVLGKQKYDTHWLMKEFPNTVKYVNLIPYIPIKGDESLDVKFSEMVKVLEIANEKHPGYLKNYAVNLDLNQAKALYEYHADVGFVERTAPTLPCGHNENFKRVNRANECFVCKLMAYCRDNASRL